MKKTPQQLAFLHLRKLDHKALTQFRQDLEQLILSTYVADLWRGEAIANFGKSIELWRDIKEKTI